MFQHMSSSPFADLVLSTPTVTPSTPRLYSRQKSVSSRPIPPHYFSRVSSVLLFPDSTPKSSAFAPHPPLSWYACRISIVPTAPSRIVGRHIGICLSTVHPRKSNSKPDRSRRCKTGRWGKGIRHKAVLQRLAALLGQILDSIHLLQPASRRGKQRAARLRLALPDLAGLYGQRLISSLRSGRKEVAMTHPGRSVRCSEKSERMLYQPLKLAELNSTTSSPLRGPVAVLVRLSAEGSCNTAP